MKKEPSTESNRKTQNTRKGKLNVRLLRRIQKHILEEPRRFFMASFFRKGEPNGKVENRLPDQPRYFPPCGTTACICGWANILTGGKDDDLANVDRAATKLGLPYGMYAPLFADLEWPQPFRWKYQSAKTPKARVKVAVARIEHLIKTGE